ncbi:hypothetical protein GCM10011367_18830 [Marinicauda pacifica]|uniref:DUF1902 domain-containing protein n=1 Tax=Marinicauda pacifica TaxID=1133559 RepID=A0A4S2HBF4_9PROT|nr:DUF1902 domain-containing protein [Marinicauda pacifica]TGY93277.1 DUF1902 domain-containing protein [Marinicauda pacifica]GGE44332.1 hypothetical protein GCM10011367_18830 [Marinicauda pacifica]
MSERINLTLRRHHDTGLLAAMSDELPGLLVFGRTVDVLIEELPPMIEVLMRENVKKNVRVLGVDLDPREHSGWAEYESARAVATYELVDAA